MINFETEWTVWKMHHIALMQSVKDQSEKHMYWHQTNIDFIMLPIWWIFCILYFVFMVWWFEFSNIIWLMIQCNRQKPHLMNYLPAKCCAYFCLIFSPEPTPYFSLLRNLTAFSPNKNLSVLKMIYTRDLYGAY